jgi:hypothetical protein
MDPLKVAAHFVAFTCYLNREANEPCSPEEAGQRARNNWKHFLPYVHENLGKLLTEPRASKSASVRKKVAPASKRTGRELTV